MNVLALTFDELTREMRRRYGKGAYHAAALYREIFKKGSRSLFDGPAFSRSGELIRKLKRDIYLPSCRILEQHEEGGVVKFTSALAEGRMIESVIIPARGRTTLCVSSQVGCRWGCVFCATGRMGFVRDLRVEEIVWQVYAARFELRRQIDNIVFMGMGEPLDNFENVVHAVRVMADQRGLDIAYRHITLSTAGQADGIRKLASANVPALRLAVSINAAHDALRSRLMPINREYPLGRLREELQAFPLGKKGVVFVEYVLLAGINDSRNDALQLARFLDGLPVRVNVIPYNGNGSEDYAAPGDDQVSRFRGWLAEEKLFVRLRQSRGRGVMAACGQLGAAVSSG